MVKRLIQHQKESYLEEQLQYAYQHFHNTETVLIKVTNDILMAIDQQKVVLLVLVDLSAAFDTVDHTIHSEKSPARSMLFYSTNYWQQF